jgi:pyridoxal phosphate enzyme (YggS family)
VDPLSEARSRIAAVEARVQAACDRAGRRRDEVRLIAVSKLQPAEAVRMAYEAGLRDFGENYAQELRDKAAALAQLAELRWHAIGPLQTNKAKYVAPVAEAFHALDRLEVARELSKRLQGRTLACYLEVNVGEETTKHGVALDEVAALRQQVASLPGLEVVGLMALPPPSDSPEVTRGHFRAVASLARRLSLPRVSMGTSADFELAIEEGATDVRVGTALFGERPARPRGI